MRTEAELDKVEKEFVAVFVAVRVAHRDWILGGADTMNTWKGYLAALDMQLEKELNRIKR